MEIPPFIRPVIMAGEKFRSFDDEPPQGCVYLVEQKLTMSDRVEELRKIGLFERNPITERKCAKWMNSNS